MSQKFNLNLLIIDDEASICESLRGILEDEGYNVETAVSSEDGVLILASESMDLVFLDILMPGGMDGIETLKRIKQVSPDIEVIMISGHGTLDLALEAGQLGVSDFLGKPLSLDNILDKVEKVSAKIATRHSEPHRDTSALTHPIIENSPLMREILLKIQQGAATNGRVLITGESGTGKELIAHAIHDFSERCKAPLVKVNCAVIPQELIESELFGHEHLLVHRRSVSGNLSKRMVGQSFWMRLEI